MPRFDSARDYLQGFRGITPIFPLPNVVLFPHSLLPLHIFEQRYRKMLSDALEGDGFLSIALYRPKLDGLVTTVPRPIHSIVGIGKIIASDRLPDGRYYLALQGLTRARLQEELPAGLLPYRTGRFECLADECELSMKEQQQQAMRLIELFERAFPQAAIKKVLLEGMDCPQPLSLVTDLLSGAIPFSAASSQILLEIWNPVKRSEMLLNILESLLTHSPSNYSHQTLSLLNFPPQFSSN